jgi:hypothetical protein
MQRGTIPHMQASDSFSALPYIQLNPLLRKDRDRAFLPPFIATEKGGNPNQSQKVHYSQLSLSIVSDKNVVFLQKQY